LHGFKYDIPGLDIEYLSQTMRDIKQSLAHLYIPLIDITTLVTGYLTRQTLGTKTL